MKTFAEYIVEETKVTHAALTKKVGKLFDSQKGNDDYETLHLRKNIHTGATKHSVGSVKMHSLGYKGKPGGNGYGGKRWTPGHVYAQHPMHKEVEKLLKKHGGTAVGSKNNGDQGGFIDTSDGYRHHFRHSLGSAFNSFEHSVHKRTVDKGTVNEMTDAEADAHNEKFEKNVVDAHMKHIHKKYGKDADVNFGSGSTDSEFTSKVYHPKKGTIRVTTHFHPETLKVEKHTEE